MGCAVRIKVAKCKVCPKVPSCVAICSEPTARESLSGAIEIQKPE